MEKIFITCEQPSSCFLVEDLKMVSHREKYILTYNFNKINIRINVRIQYKYKFAIEKILQ